MRSDSPVEGGRVNIKDSLRRGKEVRVPHVPSRCFLCQVWDPLPGWLRGQASLAACRKGRRRDTPQPWRPGPWTVKFGRNVGPGKKSRNSGGSDPGGSPSIPGWLQPQAGHSLGNAGRNEGHVNSATRRSNDFMGIFRSTPPCDGNVLGPPGRVLQSPRAGCRRPKVLTQGPGRPATVVRSAQAQPV